MVKIRAATRADRSVLLAFHHALYSEYRPTMVSKELLKLANYEDLSSALRMDVDSILARPESVALLAIDDARPEEPLGYITGHTVDDDRRVVQRRAVIEDWWVEPHARGKKIGGTLLEHILDEFRKRGCGSVESTTWPKNQGARVAHEAAGFELVEVKYRRAL